MSNTIQRIISWNRKRNSLAFDPKLEIRLLTEEANEFYTAGNAAERLREFADFRFVWNGTKAKYFAQQMTYPNDFQRGWLAFKELESWVLYLTNEMIDVIEGDGVNGSMLARALEIVTTANEGKPDTKDENGKVIKGEGYVDPMPEIRGLFGQKDDREGGFWD